VFVAPQITTLLGTAPQLGPVGSCRAFFIFNQLILNKMLNKTQTTAKVLAISSPSKELANNTETNPFYMAKIVNDAITYTQEFVTAKGDKMVIAQIKVAINDGKPFNASILSYEIDEFCKKFTANDEIKVYISTNAKGYKTADC